jgi:phosphatidylglycerophosphate synthase
VPNLDAIVLAADQLANVRIAGLTAKERAVRVAKRVGADRVLVLDHAVDLVAWRAGRTGPVLVIRANQLVHTPLVAPLVAAMPANDEIVAAVVPDDAAVQDLTPGSLAGAWIAAGRSVDAVLAAIVGGDTELTAFSMTMIKHGKIARAPIGTPAELRAAHELLYRILVKPQDNAITRYLYRPVSFPLTRLLVWTPITPNQISYVVAIMVAIGCWFTASLSTTNVLIGTVLLLAASYVDCCDGEVARVKLLSSRFGAWVDTIVDELSSVGYMAALGWHCHLMYGNAGFDPWLEATVIASAVFVWVIYCIYYNIIVAVGSANSQDYVGSFDVAPGRDASSVKLVPAAPKAIVTKRELPPWLEWLATYAPYAVRRDFISWGTVVLAALHMGRFTFIGLAVGGCVTGVIVTIDHVKLRSLRRSIVRRGLVLEAP